jgi:hypothetical protein
MSATAWYPAQLNLSGDSGCATDQNTGSSTPSAPSSRTARIPAAIAAALFTVAPSVTESMGRPTNSLAGARSSTSWLLLLCSPAPKKRPTSPAALRSLLALQPPRRAGGNATLLSVRAAPGPRVPCGRRVADAICVIIAGTVSLSIDQAVRGMSVRAWARCTSQGRTRAKRGRSVAFVSQASIYGWPEMDGGRGVAAARALAAAELGVDVRASG